MRKQLLIWSLCAILPAYAHAEKKTPEEYWTGTGLTTEKMVKDLGLFTAQACYNSLNGFKGCVAALNSLASRMEPAGRLVPNALSGDASLGFGPKVKGFTGLTLVTVPETKRDKSVTLRALWAKEQDKRKKTEAALENLFRARTSSPVDFEAILKDILPQAVKEKKDDAIAAGGAVSAYLAQAVDAHARIEPVEQLQDSLSDADESFAGIGASIQELDGNILIPAVVEGSPAEKAGVKGQDRIVAVDGKAIAGMKSDAVVKLIRGPVGSRVSVRVLRDGRELDIAIIRDNIKQENVEAKVVNDLGRKIGVIRLRSFMDDKGCATMAQKIGQLTMVDKVEGLVLDLRNNGGGLLKEAVCMGGLFFGKKVVVKVKDLSSDKFQEQASTQTQATNLPLVVLIDGGSASASEVLSGALQDHERAWILGERSFGKGSVQAPMQFPSLAGVVMFATIQRFYQPKGRTNQLVGISPNFERPFKPDATEEERFTLREGDIYPNALGAESQGWKETRTSAVSKIDACVNQAGAAKKKFAEAKAAGKVADYQLLSAQEIFACDK